MKTKDLGIRQIDLIGLFVYGFVFFIAAFDEELALGYITFIFFGSLFLLLINVTNKLKEDKK